MSNERQPLLDVEKAAPVEAKEPAASNKHTKYAAITTLAVLAVVGFVAVQMRGGLVATEAGVMNFATSASGKVSPATSSKSSSSASGSSEMKSSSSSTEETTASSSSSKDAGEPVVKYSEMDSDTKKNLFRDFKINFVKEYKDSKEESFRMQQFDSFLERVDIINSANVAAGGLGTVHGVTKFADYTMDEFSKMFMGNIPADEATKKSRMESQKAMTVHPMSGSKTSVDWTGVYTTSVNDQDRCASSWAWAASQQVESDAIRLGLMDLDDANKLSPQQILDCDTIDLGCDGGNTQTAFETVFKSGGLHYLSNYPYATTSARTHENSGCENLESSKALTLDKVNSYTWLYAVTNTKPAKIDPDSTEVAMTDFVLNKGPLSVCFNANDFQSYLGGIMTACSCGESTACASNHCGQIVGVDTKSKYWKVRNSWGADWGEEGYARMAQGTNLCNIADQATYSTPTRSSV